MLEDTCTVSPGIHQLAIPYFQLLCTSVYKMEPILEEIGLPNDSQQHCTRKLEIFLPHEKEIQCKQLWFTSNGMQAANTVSCGSDCLIVTSR